MNSLQNMANSVLATCLQGAVGLCPTPHSHLASSISYIIQKAYTCSMQLIFNELDHHFVMTMLMFQQIVHFASNFVIVNEIIALRNITTITKWQAIIKK